MSSRPSAEPESWITPEGDRVYVDTRDRTRGVAGPFYAVYRDPDRTRRYGWFCSSCESVDVVMDPMGRIECNPCGNRRKPTRWDSGYL